MKPHRYHRSVSNITQQLPSNINSQKKILNISQEKQNNQEINRIGKLNCFSNAHLNSFSKLNITSSGAIKGGLYFMKQQSKFPKLQKPKSFVNVNQFEGSRKRSISAQIPTQKQAQQGYQNHQRTELKITEEDRCEQVYSFKQQINSVIVIKKIKTSIELEQTYQSQDFELSQRSSCYVGTTLRMGYYKLVGCRRGIILALIKPFVDSNTLEKVSNDQFYQQCTLKNEIQMKQKQIEQKNSDINELQNVIQSQINDGEIQKDLVMDGLHQLYSDYKRKQQTQIPNNLFNLTEKKKQLQEKLDLQLGLNQVLQFQADVQQRNHKKITLQEQELIKQYNIKNAIYLNLESEIKTKAPFIIIKTTKTRRDRMAQMSRLKSVDEISADKLGIIEEQEKKIDSIHFQFQQLQESCIMDKQNLSKLISYQSEENHLLQQKIIEFKSLIIKFQFIDQRTLTELENNYDDDNDGSDSMEENGRDL